MVNNVALDMLNYFGSDVRRINHALKVHSFAKIIAEGEKAESLILYVLELAALLHDIGIKEAERKYGKNDGSLQEKEGPPVARIILNNNHVADDIIDRVCFLIGHHHTYNAVEGLDYQILIEADFIVNIFEDNLSRDAVSKISKKYFKTESGRNILKTLYSSI